MKKSILNIILAGFLLSGCASHNEQGERSDPLEGFNRTMFEFNYNVLDPYILRPVAVAWNDYVPGPVRTGLSNVSSNLSEPSSMVNNLLKGEFKSATHNFHRFVINSTFGIGGMIDFAGRDEGLRANNPLRFGTVLGHYGVGYGPYVVLPGYNSATPREDIGGLVDSVYPPLSWLIGWPAAAKWVIDGIETRARFLDQDQLLRDSSDPYLLMREAYFQNKDFLANDGVAVHKNPNAAEIESELDDIDKM